MEVTFDKWELKIPTENFSTVPHEFTVQYKKRDAYYNYNVWLKETSRKTFKKPITGWKTDKSGLCYILQLEHFPKIDSLTRHNHFYVSVRTERATSCLGRSHTSSYYSCITLKWNDMFQRQKPMQIKRSIRRIGDSYSHRIRNKQIQLAFTATYKPIYTPSLSLRDPKGDKIEEIYNYYKKNVTDFFVTKFSIHNGLLTVSFSKKKPTHDPLRMIYNTQTYTVRVGGGDFDY